MMKAYFYGADGKEINHRFTGKTINYMGACIIRDGAFLQNTRYEIGLHVGAELEHRVTAAEFGGQPVLVKAWYPGRDEQGHAEWFFLVAPEIGDVEASDWGNRPFPAKQTFNWQMAGAL